MITFISDHQANMRLADNFLRQPSTRRNCGCRCLPHCPRLSKGAHITGSKEFDFRARIADGNLVMVHPTPDMLQFKSCNIKPQLFSFGLWWLQWSVFSHIMFAVCEHLIFMKSDLALYHKWKNVSITMRRF